MIYPVLQTNYNAKKPLTQNNDENSVPGADYPGLKTKENRIIVDQFKAFSVLEENTKDESFSSYIREETGIDCSDSSMNVSGLSSAQR